VGHICWEIRDALTAHAAKLMHAMGDAHPTELKTEVCERL